MSICMVIYSNSLTFMDMYEYLWIVMDIYEQMLVIYGSLWKFTDIYEQMYGNLWQFLEIY